MPRHKIVTLLAIAEMSTRILFLLALIFKIQSSLSDILNGGIMGAGNAVQLIITADNFYNVYWNGEYNAGGADLSVVRQFTLVPNKQCGYENVLAITAWGDQRVDDGAIFQVRYGSQLWQSGTSPEIKVALPTSDVEWYLNNQSDSNVWVDSNTRPQCNVFLQEVEIQANYFTTGTRWIWWTACTDLTVPRVYFKLVINTVCDCEVKKPLWDSYLALLLNVSKQLF